MQIRMKPKLKQIFAMSYFLICLVFWIDSGSIQVLRGYLFLVTHSPEMLHEK